MPGRIHLVGLEVEGGWKGTKGVRPFDIPIIADLSIDGNTLQTDRRLKTTHVGEVVSSPMHPEADIIGAWIDKYWPDDSNNTCGFHIHISLKSVKDYSVLTTKGFLLYIQKSISDKAKEVGLPDNHYIWPRINGRNPFCTFNFDSSSQIAMKRKSVGDRTRYGMLNFAWNIHTTVEYRAFPTFETKELAKTFTMHYLTEVEKYLADNEAYKAEYSAVIYSQGGLVNFTVKTPWEVV